MINRRSWWIEDDAQKVKIYFNHPVQSSWPALSSGSHFFSSVKITPFPSWDIYVFFIYLTSLHPYLSVPLLSSNPCWNLSARSQVRGQQRNYLAPSANAQSQSACHVIPLRKSTKVSCQKHALAPCCAWLWHQMLRNDWEHRLYSAVGDHISSDIQLSTAYSDDASRLAC